MYSAVAAAPVARKRAAGGWGMLDRSVFKSALYRLTDIVLLCVFQPVADKLLYNWHKFLNIFIKFYIFA